MRRIDYQDNATAPKANTIIPATSAIIHDRQGKILLHQRRDNGLWALPGGTMEVGETVVECVKREVKEETGLEIVPKYVIGIYSDPNHVIAFNNGEVRQEFSICFACKVIGGSLHVSDESTDIGFFARKQIEQLPLHPSIRQRIHDFWARKRGAFY
jgi:8-oxo-dGTP pyrophosphatase MutT (NUDIX family)